MSTLMKRFFKNESLKLLTNNNLLIKQTYRKLSDSPKILITGKYLRVNLNFSVVSNRASAEQ